MAIQVTLYRAADDEIIVGCASFSTSREAAEAYRDNPGFGGANLYRAEVAIDAEELLDLYEMSSDEAIEAICALTGLRNPGAIGADEWVPRISDKLAGKGITWVRVRESYPADSETYIFIGSEDPELIEV